MRAIKTWITLAALAGSLVVSGCSASGPRFRPAQGIPEGQALVYFYRGKSVIGAAIRYHIAEGNHRIVFLKRGGYHPYFATPGEKLFWARTEAKSEVTLDVHPGETYYVRGSIVAGIGIGRPKLEVVPPEQGRREIQKLKLLPPADQE